MNTFFWYTLDINIYFYLQMKGLKIKAKEFWPVSGTEATKGFPLLYFPFILQATFLDFPCFPLLFTLCIKFYANQL